MVGIRTTLPFFRRLLRHPDFRAGRYDTGFVARLLAERPEPGDRPWHAAVTAAAIRALEDRRSARRPAAPSGDEAASGWRSRSWRMAARGW